MSNKNWHIGGLQTPKPHMFDRYEWTVILIYAVLTLPLLFAFKYVSDRYGGHGMAAFGIAYWILGYLFLVTHRGLLEGWRGSKEPQGSKERVALFIFGIFITQFIGFIFTAVKYG